jgi:hypothetical protein
MLGENHKQEVGTAERAGSKDESVSAAESVVGDYDWQPLENFGSRLASLPEKVAGQRELDMGPVTSKWPDDGIVHLDSGMIWAFGQHKYEAVAAPLLLGLFWAGVALAWWLTSMLITARMPGVMNSLLSWIVFGGAVFFYRWLLLLLTEFAFSFMETMLAAKSRKPQEEYNYE